MSGPFKNYLHQEEIGFHIAGWANKAGVNIRKPDNYTCYVFQAAENGGKLVKKRIYKYLHSHKTKRWAPIPLQEATFAENGRYVDAIGGIPANTTTSSNSGMITACDRVVLTV